MTNYQIPEEPGRKIVVCVRAAIFLIPLICLASIVQAEIAADNEMERVCRNWLAKTIVQKGQWAGAVAPDIISVQDISSNDTVLARVYNISPSGFVIVPTLKELSPIKAYSEVSTLDENQEGGFISLLRETLSRKFQIFAENYGSLEASRIQEMAIFDPQQRTKWEEYTKSEKDFLSGDIIDKSALVEAGPLTTTSWHQRSPYNDYCPDGDGGRCVVGCVATATAQILAYWQWPPSGIGTSSYIWGGDNSCGGNTPDQELTVDLSNPYDWDKIASDCHIECTPEQKAALAELNYEVGVTFEMDYGACGSGASVSYGTIVYANYFKYSADVRLEHRIDHDLTGWFNFIREEIDNNRPIQYRINLHSIVCDGYRDQGAGQYEYHMNYGWDNGFTTWYVFDNLYCSWIDPDDICPYEEEFMIVNIKPQNEPKFIYIGNSRAESDGDGINEPGENLSISLTIENLGIDAVNTVGTFSCTDENIEITSPSISFQETIQWGEQCSSLNNIELSISPACPVNQIIQLNYTLSESGGYSYSDSIYVYIGSESGFSDDFEAGEGYWTHKKNIPMYADQWHLETQRSHSGSMSWKYGGAGSNDYSNNSDGALISPPFLLPQNSILEFWHWMDAEGDSNPDSAWDGSNVWISSGDGNWSLITPDGGYPRGIINNPASPFEPGTLCYSSSFDWTPALFDLSSYSGIVQIMFRFGSDGWVTGEGWYIDDILISGDPDFICGDANGDLSVNVGDAVYIISHLFKGGPAPIPVVEAGDVNCDATCNVGDAVYLINKIFKSGPQPCADCPQ
ncbi:MAG: C10 family peptidase [Candidatus Zixiibacteriota bacterium]